MQIRPVVGNTNKLGFCSSNNPIKDFVINTDRGDLFVSEISPKLLSDRSKASNLVEFYIKNIAATSDDPCLIELMMTKNKIILQRAVRNTSRNFIQMCKIDDGNMTILKAEDGLGNLQAAVTTYSLKGIKDIEDKKTLFIENIAVNNLFQKKNIGKILLEKILNSSGDQFSDMFVYSDNMAINFYKKLGFEHFKPVGCGMKTVERLLQDGYEEYSGGVFMSKVLQHNEQRWWERIYKNSKNLIKK